MLDLSTIAQEDTAVLVLRHPKSGDPLYHEDGRPVSITLASLDSALYRSRLRAKANRRLEEAASAQRMPTQTAEQIDKDTTDVLAFATVAWDLIVDGKNHDCSVDAARKLYEDPRFGWVRLQVDAFLANRANFIPASSSTS